MKAFGRPFFADKREGPAATEGRLARIFHRTGPKPRRGARQSARNAPRRHPAIRRNIRARIRTWDNDPPYRGERARVSDEMGQPMERKVSAAGAAPPTPRAGHRGLLFAGLCYLAFVVYGSLVPLDFHAHSLTQAWQAFRHIPYLKLGVASRADWVANIVLYVPLAFFFSGVLAGWRETVAGRVFKSALVFAGCVAVAVGVEFSQLFFPPRTVSLNDIIAETLGSAIGVMIWQIWGGRLLGLWREVRAGGPTAVRAALVLYLLGYLGVSFFPYDFLVSRAEFLAKLATHRDALFLSPAACASVLRCAAGLAAEVVATLPVGVLLGILFKDRPRRARRAALLSGAVLGLAIEGVQLVLDSGTAQGISVATRLAGTLLGLFLYRRADPQAWRRFGPYLRPAAIAFLLPYLVLLTALEGWYGHAWLGLEAGLNRLSGLHFLPFYYHYYTSEAVALASLLRNVAIYLPLGLAYWAWTYRNRSGTTAAAGLAGAAAGLAIETSKLFLQGLRPDPTNVLLAFAASAMAYGAATWLGRWSTGRAVPAAPAPQDADEIPAGAGRIGPKALSLGLFALAGWAVADFPLGRAWLLAGLAGYALILARHPKAWLLILPAVLPGLDLAPWSGRFFLGAFDMLILVTLAVALWRGQPPGRRGWRPLLPWLLLSALALSYLVAAIRGLLPLQPLDGNAFSSYLSHYNALRVGKGFFWALALLPWVRALDRPALARLFVPGMVLGLASQIAATVWERAAFSSLFHFGAAYRVPGTFFAMHTGGPYIEAYLTFALPFAVLWGLTTESRVARLASVAVFAGGTYALMVTFARGGYAGFAVALAVLVAGMVIRLRRGAGGRRPGPLLPAAAAAAALAVALPIATGPYAEFRFSHLRADLAARVAQWKEALGMMDDTWAAQLLGMGLGRYPEAYFLNNSHGVLPGNYRFEQAQGGGFLRLGAGDSYGIGQIVPVEPRRRYTLSLDVRSPRAGGRLAAILCQGYILYFQDCRRFTLDAGPAGQWVRRSVAFDSGRLGGGPRFLPGRPVVIAFSEPRADAVVDVDQVRLTGERGGNLLANGDFSRGGDRWFLLTDDYSAWRIENVWLQTYFDQGAFGLAALGLLILYLVLRLARGTLAGDAVAAGLLAAFAGILTVGAFGSILDSPRVSLLFFLTLALALSRLGPGDETGR